MRKGFKYFISAVLLSASFTSFAQDDTSSTGGTSDGTSGSSTTGGTSGSGTDSSSSDALQKIETYLQNLGEYMGYDLTQYCTTGGPCQGNAAGTTGAGTPTGTSTGTTGTGTSGSAGGSGTFSNLLINYNNNMTPQLNLYRSYIGALLGTPGSNTTTSTSSTTLVPSSAGNLTFINGIASSTFPSYNNPSQQTVSVLSTIDQQTYQADPVSQAVLNILTTPSNSYCQTNDQSSWISNCQYLYHDKVLLNAIGDIPKTDDFFTYNYNQNFIPQLNVNTLLTPLMYSDTSSSSDSTSNDTSSSSTSKNAGLTASSQAQQASNFVRYITSLIDPISLPSRSEYDTLYGQAKNLDGKTDDATQRQAQATIANYLAKLRTYAAQTSVGVGNLYYIMSKRMPQNPSGSGAGTGTGTSTAATPNSQALNEFTMATWRLYNPGNTTGTPDQTQWLTQINQASSATVQKEIAILLAEINYQLYLTRQQQERQLLTESILLIQNVRASGPQATIKEIPSN